MNWVDPANWKSVDLDLADIDKLIEKFEQPLKFSDFEKSNVQREWKDLRIIHYSYYKDMTCLSFWAKIFQYRKLSFPNICVLVEMVMCIGATNGLVESGFSHLTAMLSSGKRNSSGHSTIENLLFIKVNDYSWTENEKEEIIEPTLKRYFTRRKLKMDTAEKSLSAATLCSDNPKFLSSAPN